MKSSTFKLLLISPSLILTSCGYGLKEVYKGIPYYSTVFKENYFNEWKTAINPYKDGNKITQTNEVHFLDEDADKVFYSIQDKNFKDCDENFASYKYEYDKDSYPDDKSLKRYGPTVRLANSDESFKYGITSKLFDGQMFCNGDFQTSRTQVEPTNDGADKGFGVLFSKECNDASYFMMNFKCAVVGEHDEVLESGQSSDLEITVSFVLKNDKGYTYIPVKGEVKKVPTNSGDQAPYKNLETGKMEDGDREDLYVCFGFDVSLLNLKRLIGVTVQYEKISDTVSPKHKDLKTQHAMMLYEISFPYTTWH